ncbi:MAG TPA: MFS transporter [Candidatus Didemnitutus sp.]|nr:MFS transporter [Candidatus Didemnitutus sp.]
MTADPAPAAISGSRADLRLLFSIRAGRMFAYGLVAVILVLYLAGLGFSATRIGILITLTYLGDAAISLWLTTRADRWGRRQTLNVGLVLMIAGGAAFAASGDYWILAVAATIGVISPSGNEVGPFIAVEQACLAQIVADRERTRVFAWYHVAGFTAGALGAGISGCGAGWLQRHGWTEVASYRALCVLYAACGAALLALVARLDPSVEAPRATGAPVPFGWMGLREAKSVVARLSLLFSADSFAGGFIVQSFVAYWFYRKFSVPVATLGAIFIGTNLLSGLSALLAAPLAKRIGLVSTMVWTHLPSNLLLMVVPLMPTFAGAVAVFLLRNAISQMDVPTRLSYVNAVVPAAERSAANGVTSTARQCGIMLAPMAVGPLLAHFERASCIFWISGGIKIAYDLCLWLMFSSVKPPEEG